MHEVIANIAKQCSFDAAHYTWVFVENNKITAERVSIMEERLLAHGDYAAPLKTREIKQPFDNMAVVVGMGQVGSSEDAHVLLTFDCRDSMLYEAHMWGAPDRLGGKDLRVMTLHFKPKPEAFKHVPPPSKEHNPHGKDVNDLTLVSILPNIPQSMKDGLVKTIVPMMKLVALYIPCASAGLLQGDELRYFRPSNMGNNEKRKRKGKSALYEWRTVSIEKAPPALPSAPKGGTHASPRLHQRRGHWVTSKLGKRFWRSESVVGKAENGMIFHDYVAKAKEQKHA